jgi:hypothetical protein
MQGCAIFFSLRSIDMNLFKGQSSSDTNTPLWQEVAWLVFIAIAYWVTVRLGLMFVARPEGIASIWPASGLALSVLLLRPKGEWAKLLAVIFSPTWQGIGAAAIRFW